MIIDNVSEIVRILCNAGIVFSIQEQQCNELLIYIVYNNILNSIYACEIFRFIKFEYDSLYTVLNYRTCLKHGLVCRL